MPTPFPGMDPYLEHPALWEDVHTRLIVALADAIGAAVRPHYRVAVERRAYLAVLGPDEYELIGKPDVLVTTQPGSTAPVAFVGAQPSGAPLLAELLMPDEIVERFLEIRDISTGEIITAIELLSPTNKLTREGRFQYERKRRAVLSSMTHLVEIDLLRAGTPFPLRLPTPETTSDYRIVVSRSEQRPLAEVYLFSVRDPIPAAPIPLRQADSEPTLDLTTILHDLYDRAGYQQVLNYTEPPVPPLRDADLPWVKQLLNRSE